MSTDNNGKESGSALDRYLQNQPTADASGAGPSAAAGMGTRPADLNLNLSSVPATNVEPGGFWIRFVAAVIDGAIIGLVTTPISQLLPFATKPDAEMIRDKGLGVYFATLSVIWLTGFAIALVAQFFYYGWFYSKKGASPGKMLFGLKVLNANTGTHLTYMQAFVREGLAKYFLSSLFTFGIGYLIAAFRDDKKTLHDLVCSTRVVRVKKQ
jgi:uncharacterized RDD family membrane protein YckC